MLQLKSRFLMLFVLTFVLIQSVFSQQKDSKPYTDEEVNRLVEETFSKLSQDEKLAQIEGIRPNAIMVDGKVSLEKLREVLPYGIGHFCQFSSGLTLSPNELRDFVRSIQQYLMTETPNKIPAIFHEEAITGFSTQGATTYPQQIGMGCSWNPELISKNTNTTRKNMRAAGATFALSPMLDISRTAHWERLEESYGEDAYLTSVLGLAFVKGLQSENLRNGVAATTKHFAGYGTQNNDVKGFYEEYLMPHEAVIKLGGVQSVMPSYGMFKDVPVVASKEMLSTILREKVGFKGVVVSDYGAINLTFKGHKHAKSSLEAGAMALNAGTDIELSEPICYPLLPQALEQKLVTQEKIDAAVKRSLAIKARLGLLDKNPVIGVDGDLNFDPQEYRDLAYKSACQSIVLLKNNGVLPLQKSVKKIALVGPNAASVYGLLGDYTYQSMISFWWSTPFDPNNPKLVPLSEGLAAKVGKGVEIKHERGCDWSAPLESKINAELGDDRLSKLKMMSIKGLPQPDLENAVKISKESDVIIAAVGENIYLCGEGRKRKGINLPGEQEAFVEKLIATGKPVILVIFGGRQQLVSKFEGKCAAIIQAWFPGEEGGNALADIIVGNVNPSGKLCLTYPSNDSDEEMNYKNGYSEANKPQYPFGFGLTYSTFEYSKLKVGKKASISNDWIPVSFKVKNASKIEGTEIAQLYISPKDANSTMNPIQLKGFERVELKAGEEKTIKIKLSTEQFVQYKNDGWIIEPGNFEVKVGASSTDIKLKKAFELQGNAKVLKNGRSVFLSKNE